jgi:diacylglycerol kinase (ATP)
MDVALVYNVNAGGGVSADQLRREIEAAGHRLVAMLEPGHDLALDPRTELVVVAGGDGTVRRVAIELAGRGVPLAILPMGTANNIATSLGLTGTTADLVADWRIGRRRPIDLGVALGPWGERHFIESTGAGLVANGIVVMDREKPHEVDGPGEMIAKALMRFHTLLTGLAEQRCHLVIDGETVESDLLLVEVLNIAAVGPGLRLAADAHPGDGWLDIVTAGAAHLPELERYFHERLEGHPAELTLPVRRARRVEVDGWDRVHIDDEVHTDVAGATVSIEAIPAAVEVLA